MKEMRHLEVDEDIAAERAERKRRREQRRRERQIECIIYLFFGVIVCVAVFLAGTLLVNSYQCIYRESVYATGEEIRAEDFQKDSNREIAFASGYEKVDTTIPGIYTVKIKSGPFTYKCKAIVKDTIAPVIEGAKDFSSYVGEAISYKSGVSVKDNFDEKVSLQVDHSKVNMQEEGIYPVTYYAEDASGNKTSVTVNLELTIGEYTEYSLNLMAQEVLDDIITEGMSQLEILEAIYTWTRGTIHYSGGSDKENWIKTACDGFKKLSGDCFTFASVAKALLNGVGIENKDIKKIPAETRHYWNLVNIGEGWYHFDATPRQEQDRSFCYITDEVLMDYSNTHNMTHNYDRSVYTDIE